MEKNNLPGHIAIIMDGNGRWARRHGLPRIMGHRKGIKTAQKIVEVCVDLGIEILTLYAFSSDNWKRPREEVNFLMKMLKDFLRQESNKIIERNVRFKVIGRIEELPESVRKELTRIIEATKENTGLILNLALNYGGRVEIVDAVRKICEEVKKNRFSVGEIDEELFSRFLYTRGMADPDLLIRTGGELRVSNFLLWQISYTEIYISNKLWPNFTRADLERAIASFKKRERRFGAIPV